MNSLKTIKSFSRAEVTTTYKINNRYTLVREILGGKVASDKWLTTSEKNKYFDWVYMPSSIYFQYCTNPESLKDFVDDHCHNRLEHGFIDLDKLDLENVVCDHRSTNGTMFRLTDINPLRYWRKSSRFQITSNSYDLDKVVKIMEQSSLFRNMIIAKDYVCSHLQFEYYSDYPIKNFGTKKLKNSMGEILLYLSPSCRK